VTMDEQPGPGRGLWPRLRVGVIVAAVALAGLLYVAVNHRNETTSGNGAAATPSGPGSPTPLAVPSGPACLPRVLETGFFVFQQAVEYGITVRSDCPQALINIAVSVLVLDTTDRPVDGFDSLLPFIDVLLPGQQIGAAGVFAMTTAKPVGRVEIRFTDALPAPVSVFAGWPTSVRVADLTFDRPDHAGGVRVTGRIVTEPANAILCFPHTNLILRDSAGAIVGGRWGLILGEPGRTRATTSFLLPKVPATADLSKTTAYVTLGGPQVDVDAGKYNPSGAACR
jgi:hypothetical protein